MFKQNVSIIKDACFYNFFQRKKVKSCAVYVAALMLTGCSTSFTNKESSNAEEKSGHYPYVNILNCTDYTASGTVQYPGVCSNDNYTVNSKDKWTASSRGACLVSSISAVITKNGGNVVCDSYQSTGTAYADFQIMSTPEGCQVCRPDDCYSSACPTSDK